MQRKNCSKKKNESSFFSPSDNDKQIKGLLLKIIEITNKIGENFTFSPIFIITITEDTFIFLDLSAPSLPIFPRLHTADNAAVAPACTGCIDYTKEPHFPKSFYTSTNTDTPALRGTDSFRRLRKRSICHFPHGIFLPLAEEKEVLLKRFPPCRAQRHGPLTAIHT